MITTPILDISIVNTYNPNVLSIADVSYYPLNYQINNPYIEVTAPGYPKKTLIFTPKSLNVYNSITLDISTDCTVPLPDGIYKIRYSIKPNFEMYVDKTYLRVDALLEKFDTAFLKVDVNECDTKVRERLMFKLREVEMYIQTAMAAANKCNEKLAYELFLKANKYLDKLECYVSDMQHM